MAKKGTTRYRSNKQEKEVAKSLGGKKVIASGSLWFADSDVRNDRFLVECKTTQKDFYSITTKVWEKIENEALKDGMRTPLLVVDLRDSERYVIFNPTQFNTKVDAYDISVHGGCKSYRLKEIDFPKLFSLVPVSSKKRQHLLMVMPFKDFEEFLEKEESNNVIKEYV